MQVLAIEKRTVHEPSKCSKPLTTRQRTGISVRLALLYQFLIKHVAGQERTTYFMNATIGRMSAFEL